MKIIKLFKCLYEELDGSRTPGFYDPQVMTNEDIEGCKEMYIDYNTDTCDEKDLSNIWDLTTTYGKALMIKKVQTDDYMWTCEAVPADEVEDFIKRVNEEHQRIIKENNLEEKHTTSFNIIEEPTLFIRSKIKDFKYLIGNYITLESLDKELFELGCNSIYSTNNIMDCINNKTCIEVHRHVGFTPFIELSISYTVDRNNGEKDTLIYIDCIL